MKTNLILSFALLCTVASTPICSAQAEINAFKQGSVWIETHQSMYEPGICVYTYTIDGECEINGRTCMQLWRKVTESDVELSSGLYTYLYTEGDKVFFVPTDNTEASYLMYDFGMNQGETTEVVDFENYRQHGNSDYLAWTNVETSKISSCGNELDRIKIVSPSWGDETWHNDAYWIKGIGYELSLVGNISYIDAIGMGSITNVVMVDGEVVYRSDASEPCAIESVQTDEPAMRYNLDGSRARNAHGICIENHRVVLNMK